MPTVAGVNTTSKSTLMNCRTDSAQTDQFNRQMKSQSLNEPTTHGQQVSQTDKESASHTDKVSW